MLTASEWPKLQRNMRDDAVAYETQQPQLLTASEPNGANTWYKVSTGGERASSEGRTQHVRIVQVGDKGLNLHTNKSSWQCTVSESQLCTAAMQHSSIVLGANIIYMIKIRTPKDNVHSQMVYMYDIPGVRLGVYEPLKQLDHSFKFPRFNSPCPRELSVGCLGFGERTASCCVYLLLRCIRENRLPLLVITMNCCRKDYARVYSNLLAGRG